MPDKDKPRYRLFVVTYDADTNKYLAQPLSSYDAAKSKEQYLGRFLQQEDAEAFAQYKNLRLSPDGAAALLIEHEMIKSKVQPLKSMEKNKLIAQVKGIRATSGCQSFGNCSSLQGNLRCAKCYQDNAESWKLCARTTRLLEEDD